MAHSKSYIHVPIKHKYVKSSQSAKTQSKAAPLNESLQNGVMQYVASFQIGTPGQNVQCLLDTGSSDLWVYTPQASASNSFDPSKSSTYTDLNETFTIQYVSGSDSGEWGEDTVIMGSDSIANQQLATVNTAPSGGSADSVGILGVGYGTGESAQKEYSNFPQSLVAKGYISRIAYSLYLDDLNASTGSILFGAVDTAKYSGNLYTVPVTSKTSLQVAASYGGTSFQAVLDSGTSLIYLPQAAVDSIAQSVGATFDQGQEVYTLASSPTQSISFSFSGVSITIPGSELAIPLSDLGISDDEVSDKFLLPVLPNTQAAGYNLLGDAFLRSAYVVYDLTQNQISIAQASYSSSSKIELIPATGEIPGATAAPSST